MPSAVKGDRRGVSGVLRLKYLAVEMVWVVVEEMASVTSS